MTPRENEDHFATLGISPGADRDEIKQAYRTLSLRYHPDSASAQYQNNPEKFIAINKAYHALLTAQLSEESEAKSIPKTPWRKNRARRFSSTSAKKLFIWIFGSLVILAVLSTIASITVKNRAMLAGLRKSRTGLAASVPPAKDPHPQKVTTIPSTPKPLPAEPIEQKEHIQRQP